jgi:hypothetical protein
MYAEPTMINRINNTTIKANPAPYPPAVGALINKHLHVYLLSVYVSTYKLTSHMSLIHKIGQLPISRFKGKEEE